MNTHACARDALLLVSACRRARRPSTSSLGTPRTCCACWRASPRAEPPRLRSGRGARVMAGRAPRRCNGLGRAARALPTVEQGVQRARDDEDAAHGDEQVEVKVPRLLDGEVDRRVACRQSRARRVVSAVRLAASAGEGGGGAGCVGKARYRRVVVVQRRPARICVAAAPDLLELLAHLAAAVVHRAAPERLAGDRVPDRCVRLGRVRRRGGRRVEAGGGAQRPLLVRVRAWAWCGG